MLTILFIFFFGTHNDKNLEKTFYEEDNMFSKALIEKSIVNQNNVLEKIFDEVNYIQSDINYVVRVGDTLIKILISLGISYSDAHKMSNGINKVYNLKNLSVGQKIRFIFDGKEEQKIKLGEMPYQLKIYFDNKVVYGICNNDKNICNFKIKKQITNARSKFIEGNIKESIYNSALKAGAPTHIVMQYIDLLKKEVNLKKEIKNGTKFKILYDVQEDESGKVIGKPKLTYASLNSGENEMKIYNYEDPKSKIVNGYFYSDGRSLGKKFFNKPIPGARVSSGFGMRIHPILKYKKMHKGVDFIARKGTPIKSVANGVVELVHTAFGYGKYIIIKHDNAYSSLYAHMSKFKAGIKKGQIIKANEIIGYVGNTGMSTSVHLHYEIRYFGKPVNPLKLTFNANNKLDGKTFMAFNKQKNIVDKLVDKESKLMLASVK